MEDIKQKILMKNNVLVKAKYDLTVNENKIFQLILFNFQVKNDTTLFAEIPKKEFEKILKSSASKTEKAISSILLKLRKGDIWIITAKGWDNYGFIDKFGYNNETETFNIKGDKELYDILMDYLKGYTPININIFFTFKSYHTQRFYELLRLWSNSKHIINYSLEELKELLMLKDKYPLYKDFKKRIINPVLKELNEKSLMQIEIKENKVNRKVVSIDFIVTDNDKRKYFEKDKNVLEHQQDQNKNYNKSKDLKFNNFDQRDYDYKKLERQLLGWETD